MTWKLLCDLLLVRGVELLLKGDWLEGGEPASNIVNDWNGLWLSRGQACGQRDRQEGCTDASWLMEFCRQKKGHIKDQWWRISDYKIQIVRHTTLPS